MTKHRLAILCVLLAGCADTATPSANPPAAWEGTWEGSNGHAGELSCQVAAQGDGQWEGKFTGTCDRRFAYEVKMQGKKDGDTIRFTGQADLGEKDGGLFQWTGRIEGDQFIGEYKSDAGKTGKFQMKVAEK
jgi:hypothetical protein